MVVLYAELLGEGEVGAVGSRVIPTLDGRAKRTQGDAVVEVFREVPLVRDFATEKVLVVFGELSDRVVRRWVLSCESAAVEDVFLVFEAKLVTKAGNLD